MQKAAMMPRKTWSEAYGRTAAWSAYECARTREKNATTRRLTSARDAPSRPLTPRKQRSCCRSFPASLAKRCPTTSPLDAYAA